MNELSAIDEFKIFKNEPQFENILKRLVYKKQPELIPFENSGIHF